jgi:hypothetical protein
MQPLLGFCLRIGLPEDERSLSNEQKSICSRPARHSFILSSESSFSFTTSNPYQEALVKHFFDLSVQDERCHPRK